ncbi:MAG: fumarylacetoacetate hydrolase family protein [Sphingobacteriales bacterium]|nr:MAG: fumarylacetoacetate hydrolase family protein [Sphingobacteriales bacterium]
MKLVSIEQDGSDKLAILVDSNIYPLAQINPLLPTNMADFLKAGDEVMEMAKTYDQHIKKDPNKFNSYPLHSQKILAPVPFPTSCRDGYAFRQHVATARRNRGVPMIPEFDMYPIFYFTNHNAMDGPGELTFMPDHFQKLDFELEAAIVIGKKGKNIRAAEADEYIAGYMIMNDLSARTLQMEEMLLNLGPAKGKDFGTVIGPYLLTPDELEPYKVSAPEGHVGNQFNLKMKAFVNGVQVSEGNTSQMDWTFAEIIERASYGVDVYPGDVIGSGTVGTGCFLELNGTGLLNDKNYQTQWLQEGDEITLEIDMLGSLTNTIRKEDTDYSILALKKQPKITEA